MQAAVPPGDGAMIAVIGEGVATRDLLALAGEDDVDVANRNSKDQVVLSGGAGAIALFALLSYAAVRVLRRAVPESRPPRWLVLATRPIAALSSDIAREDPTRPSSERAFSSRARRRSVASSRARASFSRRTSFATG